ncbi:hypothetical protein [Caulobacter rhizosphaerae]|uniref:hypothetical protein n=1 Tax=Caulobacter rhizosphaerae TaxID=2010972 RepID=UPI0013D35479|nr:hypothetical protein [Caulobacter rhizosphaerae]GGL48411.1 hypothetical protein GCM10010983_52200 [Caulobacter rhizosphaerae]
MTEEQRSRALRARALLGDETLQEALDAIEAGLMAQCRGTAPGAVSLREEIWGEIRALQSIRTKLKSWDTDLTVAERQAERRR